MRFTITTKRWRENVGTWPAPCPKCADTRDATVVREHASIHLGELPLFALPATWTWRCGTCGDSRAGRRPAGAPQSPFIHRFGWLVFLVLPAALVLGGIRLNNELSHAHARAALEAMRPAEDRAKALRERQDALVAKLNAARSRCLAVTASRGAARTAPPRAPADLEALRGSPLITRAFPAPSSALFGPPLDCEKRYPALTQLRIDVPSGDLAAAMAKLDQVEQELSKREASVQPLPPVVVLLEKDFLLGTPPKKSVLTATWINTADGSPLAVAHSDEVWRGDDVMERVELTASLSRQLDRW